MKAAFFNKVGEFNEVCDWWGLVNCNVLDDSKGFEDLRRP